MSLTTGFITSRAQSPEAADAPRVDSPHAASHAASHPAPTPAPQPVLTPPAHAPAPPAGLKPPAPLQKAACKPRPVEGHETFRRDELVLALSHYDIGIIESLEDYPRGSRKSPKIIIRASEGRFLLKRRARGRDDVNKVAFCHDIQQHLARKQFPLPHLIGTLDGGTSMLLLDKEVYELFEYISGQGYNQSIEATREAGRILALYHKLLEDFATPYEAPTGSYHAASAVEKGFDRILHHLAGRKEIAPICRFLLDSYLHARDCVNDAGIAAWPSQIVHGDWHPGNMLFRDNRVVAVIDYDSARLLPRVIDSSNGALQFSILGGGDDVTKWPAYIDESRFKRFLRGYDEVNLLSEAELRATPWLMIEALIAEAVFPIAATGQFGKLEGASFLNMVKRKIVWLQRNADRLVELVAT